LGSAFVIADVVCHAALPADQFAGLICYASCCVGAFRIDGMQVRRGKDGVFRVKWAARKDAAGYEHPYVQVADPILRPAVKAEVERLVLAAAKRGGWIP
jgi:hypothetical protein